MNAEDVEFFGNLTVADFERLAKLNPDDGADLAWLLRFVREHPDETDLLISGRTPDEVTRLMFLRHLVQRGCIQELVT